MSLSGWQKQRICISRAILANCPLPLLDEATATLNTESEQLVQQSLGTFREGRTVIIVAHRLATAKHANRIIVMQNGRVAETDTHEELLSRNSILRRPDQIPVVINRKIAIHSAASEWSLSWDSSKIQTTEAIMSSLDDYESVFSRIIDRFLQHPDRSASNNEVGRKTR
jgi:ABC-type multidrug transport system ATPase subunit